MKKTILKVCLLLSLSSCGNKAPNTETASKEAVVTDTSKVASPASVQTDSTALPANLKSFVLPNYDVLKFKKGDLNQDNMDDYVVVLEKQNSDGDALRPLLLITQKADGTFSLAAKNDSIVSCRACGGKMDPLAGITIKDGFFTIEHEGGSREMWTQYITFRFNKELNTWVLHRIDESDIDTLNEKDKGRKKARTDKNFGKILFTAYNAEKMN
jgi:hypothetical protein